MTLQDYIDGLKEIAPEMIIILIIAVIGLIILYFILEKRDGRRW
jgi:hypothetical protein